MSKFDVNGNQPLPLAPSGSPDDLVLFNFGPSNVYAGGDTSIARDPAAEGLRIPPLTYKEWRAGRPLWLMCAPGESASILSTVDEGGLITPPVGQYSATIANQTPGTGPTSITLGPFDMSRFDSFAFEFADGGGIASGTNSRDIYILWGNSAGDMSGITFRGDYFLNDWEQHTVLTQGGFMHLQGKCRAPFMKIVINAGTAGTEAIASYRLTGYLQPLGVKRTAQYGYNAIISGTIDPTVGTIQADGSRGGWKWDIPALGIAAGTSVTAYLANSWAGPCNVGLRAVGAVSTSVLTLSLQTGNGQEVGIIDLPPTTVVRSGTNVQMILPTSVVKIVVSNNSSAALGAGVTVQMLDRSGA